MTFKLFGLATVLLAASLLSACNTMSGAGQDVRGAGTALERAAERNK